MNVQFVRRYSEIEEIGNSMKKNHIDLQEVYENENIAKSVICL